MGDENICDCIAFIRIELRNARKILLESVRLVGDVCHKMTNEWVAVTRKGLEKIGEYFTDDKADAIATANVIAAAYRARGFDAQVFAK